MSGIYRILETVKTIDEHGNETVYQIVNQKEMTSSITKNDEPDYIKIYTKIWAEFNNIPLAYRELFLRLATRMTYCNGNDLGDAQLVQTGKYFSDEDKKKLGWKDAMYNRALGELVKTGAIRRVAKGLYQINPSYAGKGEWKYNPKLECGGVEDLVASFNFKDGTVETVITWADNGTDDEMNYIYRDGMNVKAKDETVLKTTKKIREKV